MLKFLGRGSAFADEHNSAFFVAGNDLVLIDCPATAYHKVKKMDWKSYDNIYVLVTHTHGDHSGGVGTLLQHVWFVSGMKKKVTVVAPSREVKEDLILLLSRIEGCEREWYNITTANNLDKEWLVAAVPTVHVITLPGKCFGYHLRIDGKDVIYTGDTSTLTPFANLASEGSYLYSEISCSNSGVHLYTDDVLPQLVALAERGVNVYLMHIDNEEEIKKAIEGTPLKLAELADCSET